jgi:integrase/recombinase XerD
MYNLLDDIAEYDLNDKKITPFKNLLKWEERWIESIKMKKRSINTIKSYEFGIRSLFTFVKRHRKIPIDQIGAKYINRYLIDYQIILATESVEKKELNTKDLNTLIKESKKKSIGKNDANFTILKEFENTLAQRLTVVKIFLKFISENNKEQHDYTRVYDMLAKIRIGDKFTDHLTKNELQQIVEYMQIWTEVYKDHKKKSSLRYAYRDAMMIIIYALSGGRSEEAVHIKLGEIREVSKSGIDWYIIKISKGKGGKSREISVEKKYLVKFVEYFKRELPDDSYYISSTYRKSYTNKPMDPNAIRTFGNTILSILNIKKSGLHAFRRGYVTKRIGNDEVDASIVSKEVGNTVAILEKHYLKHDAEAFIK